MTWIFVFWMVTVTIDCYVFYKDYSSSGQSWSDHYFIVKHSYLCTMSSIVVVVISHEE